MKLPLGLVGYVNALPLSLPLNLEFEIEPVYGTPIELAEKLKNGSLDVALTSSILACSENYDFLPGYGIAMKSKGYSTNLYHCSDFFSKSRPTVAVTSETLSIGILFRILCTQYWNISPEIISLSPYDIVYKDFDAVLLIGNQGLENQEIPGFKTQNLIEAWHDFTELPFVSSLFLLRPGFSQEQRSLLEEQITRALTWSKTNPTLVLEASSQLTNINRELLLRHFKSLRYKLTDLEMAGFEEFCNFYNKLILPVCR
ncbi:MqnA/MqnD/SBP family protein [Candidatus Clavichlamydia salmonicola]|uniref:MqnA/MqnD/SBP family protein n=1 Tax=Candidatus Clavichlamydia salmonicola TaxID=469812 RepID=UPI001890FB9A|nr:MqnA/MqnD/SBP family protein [Candidatus Clavichlamydia salmonicola]